jgi:16S rRNA (guanine527-N7)-methyltransferase
MALVSRADADRLVTRHIADSVFAAAHCVDGEAVVDLGSGAGFPGLPLAVLRPASRVCLIESKAKKVSFLVEAIRVTAAPNVTVCHARIEAAANDDMHRGRYAVAISRALADSDAYWAAAKAFLAPGGRIISMRSAVQEIRREGGAVIEYRLPDGAHRRLVITRV